MSSSDDYYTVLTIYTDGACTSTAVYMDIAPEGNCASNPTEYDSSECFRGSIGDSTKYGKYSCTNDVNGTIYKAFGEKNFIVYYQSDDQDCQYWTELSVYNADDSCQANLDDQSVRANMKNDGTASFMLYNDTSCTSTVLVNANSTNYDWHSGECMSASGNYHYFLTRDDLETSSSSGSTGSTATSTTTTDSGISIGALVGIIVGVVVALLLVGVLIWRCRRKNQYKNANGQEALLPGHDPKSGSTQPTIGTAAWIPSSEGGTALWEDEAIISSRVPREKVVVEALLSRGGYGEVYKGTYNGQDVAIKMLLPETRRSLKHVNAFLAETKMIAALEHSRIVQFIGVAWDSLNDLCVLSEYMDGGDLRALLVHFDEINHPQGFDHDKVKIALHIAHALTYLHTLEQPIIHRDLKSKNVLLTQQLDAKLTDFGISREREDSTMTAGVGTSLWMAPEVMMGDKYDVKADMFSFGVMLSELDVHSLPYAHAKENSNTGRKMPDAAILQMVAMGTLRVSFSPGALPSMVELGLACVSTDPKDRPTSAEALYKLQTILRNEL